MRLSIETLKKIEAEFGEFDISQVLGGSNDMYLRFGYWNQINSGKLTEILGTSIIVEEDSDYDDDCGYKHMYRLFDTIFYNKTKLNELY
jgi:hypothetical protein